MKKALLLLFFLSLYLPLFSHEGSMAGSGKLRVSQTKYFDIIYSEKNLATAQILYENADQIFEELTATYGAEPNYRLPVVITTTVEQFNAYYADSPFNRIVIYDTAQIEDLAVFSQTLLSTFTHELTHAVTYNYKNKTMRTLGKIFGDAFANHYITVTSGMAEGATVSYESSNGEGRLNDPYALQQIRQAKIEGKFPTYSDVKGASDAYPRNAFYYFNGAFAEYLQKNYGMEKYAEFWYRCINIEHLTDLTAGGAFKKTYGIKINKAWKMFKEAEEVPEVAAAEPVAAGQACDFFEAQKEKPSIKNRAGSLYTNLSAGGNVLVFTDESCDTVYAFKNGKVKKLFTRDYIDSVRLSGDGRFLAVGYYSTTSATIKHKAAVYDMQYNKWIEVLGTNYVSPAIVSNGSSYYFVAQNYEPQKYSVCVKKMQINGRKVKVEEENSAQYFFATEEVPTSFTDLGNGQFAFILKSALEYSVCVTDVLFTDITQYKAPLERMKFRDLSVSGSSLMFSWATKETLPRLGTLDLSSGMFSLSQENISGGVYTPVEFEGHIYYTAHYFKETRLLELVEFDIKPVSVMPEQSPNTTNQSSVIAVLDTAISEDIETPIPYTPFNPFRYTFEGLFLPIGGINSRTPLLGFTYFTSLPWYSGIAMLSGGYDTNTKTGVFDLSYQSGTDTNLFTYIIDSSFAVDKSGFKNLLGDVYLNSAFNFGKISMLSLSAQANASYGRLINESTSVHFATTQFSTIAYSNVIKSGPGTHEQAGVTIATGVVHFYQRQLEPLNVEVQDQYDLEFDFSFNIPKLLPVICYDDFTYNLPSKVSTYFFSLSSTQMSLARINTETILFAYDIQKAIPGISALFANDIILTFGYTGGYDYLSVNDSRRNWHFRYTSEYLNLIKNHTIKYKDYYNLKLTFGFTPNIGSFANPQAKMNFYVCANFGKKENRPEKIVDCGLEAKF